MVRSVSLHARRRQARARAPAPRSSAARAARPPAPRRAISRLGPTASSTATAGTFSDNCSARRTVTVPWKVRSKFSGCIAGIADRPVLDQRLGMDQPVLEAEPIDEGLERRARRADRLGEIDLAGAALVEIIGRGDPGQHLAGCVVDHDDRDRHVRRRASARARGRAFRESFANRASMVSRSTRSFGVSPRAPGRRHAGRSAASACARSARPLAWRARSRRR